MQQYTTMSKKYDKRSIGKITKPSCSTLLPDKIPRCLVNACETQYEQSPPIPLLLRGKNIYESLGNIDIFTFKRIVINTLLAVMLDDLSDLEIPDPINPDDYYLRITFPNKEHKSFNAISVCFWKNKLEAVLFQNGQDADPANLVGYEGYVHSGQSSAIIFENLYLLSREIRRLYRINKGISSKDDQRVITVMEQLEEAEIANNEMVMAGSLDTTSVNTGCTRKERSRVLELPQSSSTLFPKKIAPSCLAFSPNQTPSCLVNACTSKCLWIYNIAGKDPFEKLHNMKAGAKIWTQKRVVINSLLAVMLDDLTDLNIPDPLSLARHTMSIDFPNKSHLSFDAVSISCDANLLKTALLKDGKNVSPVDMKGYNHGAMEFKNICLLNKEIRRLYRINKGIQTKNDSCPIPTFASYYNFFQSHRPTKKKETKKEVHQDSCATMFS